MIEDTVIAKCWTLKTDLIFGRNQKYSGNNPEYHFSLQTKCEANLKMFHTREGYVRINGSILKKAVSMVILRETLYLNEYFNVFAINLFHLCIITLFSF